MGFSQEKGIKKARITSDQDKVNYNIGVILVAPFKINKDSMKAEIDLSKDRVFIVKNGIVKCKEAPATGFGEQVITWQDGRAVYFDEKYKEKL